MSRQNLSYEGRLMAPFPCTDVDRSRANLHRASRRGCFEGAAKRGTEFGSKRLPRSCADVRAPRGEASRATEWIVHVQQRSQGLLAGAPARLERAGSSGDNGRAAGQTLRHSGEAQGGPRPQPHGSHAGGADPAVPQRIRRRREEAELQNRLVKINDGRRGH